MVRVIDINADLGEGYGTDEALLGVVSSANIACGFHAGDAQTMRTVGRLAGQKGVAVGAHPSFDDLGNFGRTVMRISEIETGRCHHEPVDLDARALLADLHDYYDVLADQRGVVLQIRVEDDLPLMGDRALLFQALVNLIDNAIKYAPPGSAITLLARRRGPWIELGTADQGPGIDADQRSQAVQRFRRLTRDRTISGHGLGLALVHAVAALHGGSLALADNDPGPPQGAASGTPRGLLAILRLPCKSAAGGRS